LRFCLQQVWPIFSALSTATIFFLCRRLGSLGFACVATVFVFTGEGLAGLLGLFHPGLVESDPIVWSSVFLAPSATWLYYNTWGPALVVMAGALYALSRIDESVVWVVLVGLLVAVLPQVKILGYLVMVPALLMTTLVLWYRRRQAAGRVACATALAVVSSLSWILPLLLNRDESRVFLIPAWLTLPKRMLFKLSLAGPLNGWALAHGFGAASGAFVLVVAVVLFLLGGLAFRLFGGRSLWRAAMARTTPPAPAVWTAMGWIVIVACLLPFVVTVLPPPNGVQPYVAGLLFAWIFAVDGWIGRLGGAPVWRWLGLLIAFVISAVPLCHYAAQAVTRQAGEPWVASSSDDRIVADALNRLDPEKVVVLHDNPEEPSLISIMAQRRVVVAWLDTVGWADRTESDARASEVDAFFTGHLGASEGRAMLRRYHVTHVVEHLERDHIDQDLLAVLVPIVRTPGARLYEVSGY
jgi:hypothetical protein